MLGKLFAKKRFLLPLIVISSAFYLWSNAKVDRLPAVPENLRSEATLLGLPDIRAFPDETDKMS